MKLILKILTGERKDQKIILQNMDILINNIPYILEDEAFILYLEIDKYYPEIILLMDGIDYNFTYEKNNNDIFFYVLKPKYKKFGYEALFFNYIGIANIEIQVDQFEKIFCSYIEVLARKITAEQVKYMINYIFENDEHNFLHTYFSATRLNSGYNKGEDPQYLLNKLIKIIKNLNQLLPYIINNPLTRISREIKMENGYLVEEIDDQGLAWLNENLSILEETDDVDKAHVYYDGVYYLAREIQTTVIIEDTNIYENQILYIFLLKLQQFILEIENNMSKKYRKTGNNKEGYFSFFSIMNSLKISENKKDIIKIMDCKRDIKRLIHLFKNKISVTILNELNPVLTHKIKSNRFYASIFRIMVEWYKFNKIDWRSQEMLLAIKSVPEIFEYYTFFKIKTALISFCEKVNNEPLSYKYKNIKINLHYQPNYWMVGHKNAEYSKYLRTEIGETSFYKTIKGFKPSNHKYSKRVPDIVIELTIGKQNFLLVLDAKYSTMKTAFQYYLRDCGMKYIHGIHHVNGSSPVIAMILICPTQKQDEAILADMHAPPYGVFNNKTVFPALGVQGILLKNLDQKNNYSIKETIKKILDLKISQINL